MKLESISLTVTLKKHLNLNLARLKCLSCTILALVEVRTINLVRLAQFFDSDATADSSYKRLQRFIREVRFAPDKIAHFILTIMDLYPTPKWGLILDRTNWKIGKIHINILYLAVVHSGIAIPLFGLFSQTKNRATPIIVIESES